MKTIGDPANHRDRLRGYEVTYKYKSSFEIEFGPVVEFTFEKCFPYREGYEGGVMIRLPGPSVWNRAKKDYFWEYNGPRIWLSGEVFDAATRRAIWGRGLSTPDRRTLEDWDRELGIMDELTRGLVPA